MTDAPHPSSPPPGGALRVISSLRLGERVVARCGDGLLAAENALFDAKDTVLRTTDPNTVREAGYMTTAREALGRLAMAGITPEFAYDAARTLAHDVAASFARGETARALAARLGPHELFDGAVYSASAQRYEGVWLDLRALSGALNSPAAPVVLQALHLAAALSEVAPSTTVLLSTSATRRPSERAHFRMILEGTRWLLEALYRLGPNPRPPDAHTTNEERMREVLLARVRERATADASPHLQHHLGELENAITAGNAPRGPIAGGEFAAIERQLAGGEASGVDERIDRLEALHGVSAGTRYLRARAALLRGDTPPLSVATMLSQIVDEDTRFHEASLLAARAWHAAGDSTRARYYARRIVEDPAASDGERLVALEILESTTTTHHSMTPPSVVIDAPTSGIAHVARPRVAHVTQMQLARVPLYPTLGGAPPPHVLPPLSPVNQAAPVEPEPVWDLRPQGRAQTGHRERLDRDPPLRGRPDVDQTDGGRPDVDQIDGGFSDREPSDRRPRNRPPLDREREQPVREQPARGPSDRTAAPRGRPTVRYDPELAESLALPHGATESMLGVNDLPTTAMQARVAMTRLARDLARDYRLWYAKTLRCNVMAVEAMQQHIANRFAGAPISDPGVAWELRRHGALLSEIAARALGGTWVDVAPSEPGYWEMLVPPGTRTRPIGRVYRFVALGNRERDLVSYYLDLDARVRKGR